MNGKVVNNQRGSIINVVLLILMMLTFMVGYGLMSSQTDLLVVRNDKIAKATFYAAEAGIEVGRATLSRLLEADVGNWNNLLQGNQGQGEVAGTNTLDEVIDDFSAGARQVGPATYTLQVRDNNDYDDNLMVDNDYTVILISTGIWNNARSVIETEVHHIYGEEYAQSEGTSDSSGSGAGGGAVAGNLLQ